MQLSQLIASLQKVVQVAGDLPVIVKDVESEAETELKSIGLHIDPASGDTSGSVSLEHGEAEAPDSPSNPPEATPPAQGEAAAPPAA